MIGYTRATHAEGLLQEVRFMSRKSLILLAPRPGLEPGTYGLTVALKDVLNSSRFSLIFCNLLILIRYKYYMT